MSTWTVVGLIFLLGALEWISDYIAREDERKAGTRGRYDFSAPKRNSRFPF